LEVELKFIVGLLTLSTMIFKYENIIKEKERLENDSLIREKGKILISVSQFPCRSQELEILEEKHFEGFHTKKGPQK
jgi:hypothetical protein